MIPKAKEKALELYYNFQKCKDKSNRYFIIPITGDAKQCALMAVDFAKENPLNTEGYNKYLEEVKQEIEKL